MYIKAILQHYGLKYHNTYPLKNAEITFYTSPQCTTIAKDINNNNCVGLTNDDGKVSFEVNTNQNTVYYAKITRMPFGYSFPNSPILTARPCDFTSNASCAVFRHSTFDSIIIIPPKVYDFGLRSKIDPNIIIASYFAIAGNPGHTTWYYGIGRDIDGNPWRVDQYKLIYPTNTVYVWCDEGTQNRVENGRIVSGSTSQPWQGYPYFDQMFGAIRYVVHYYEQHVG